MTDIEYDNTLQYQESSKNFLLENLMNIRYKPKYSVLFYKHLDIMQGSENAGLL